MAMQITTKGFTLIELIVVIVILAIVAKFAISRYIDLSTTSQTNATKSIAAALATASANNFAARTAGGTGVGSAVSNCNQIASLLTGGLPTGYAITSTAITAGTSQTCTLMGPSSTSATFNGLGIS